MNESEETVSPAAEFVKLTNSDLARFWAKVSSDSFIVYLCSGLVVAGDYISLATTIKYDIAISKVNLELTGRHI
jgi:hypothetical protein